MARKLSGIARQGCIRLAVGIWLTAGVVALAQSPEQDKVQVSSPAQVVQNPFATGGTAQPVPVPDEPESPREVATTYRNPFATPRTARLKLAPPISLPARPGPISRWQRSNVLADEPTSVRSAILDTAPARFDPFPSNKFLRSDAPGGVNFGRPPDPIQFAPQSPAQPAWMTGDVDSARPLSRVGAGADVDPITVDAFNLPTKSFNVAASEEPSVQRILDGAASGTASLVSPDWLPVIVSDNG